MSNALSTLLCNAASLATAAGATQPATSPTSQPTTQPIQPLDPSLVLIAVGICVLVVWIVRRLAEPLKLTLAGTPGRPSTLNPLHLLAVLLVWISAQSGAAELLRIYLAEDSFAFRFWPNTLGGIVLVLGCLLVAKLTFTHGLKRGFALSMRHWLYDTGRGLVGALAVLPICYVLRYVAIQLLPPDQPPVHQLLTMIAEGTRAQQIAVILAAVVLAPLAEEMFFRGLLQTMLRKYLHSPWLAIALGSAAFAAVHLPVQDIPAIFALSVVLGYNYERCGRLYASILMHALFNAANIWMFLSTHSG